ncbi:MAG: hypothetical protein DRR16_33690 [Candidatus Parabeggiatoa sp. nov. 3]|nr:MAG: hypothetical protein DRR00_34345 [Gammaproteobacteria bacterium]RKZ72818.1 MAG: hypothetical protein DRR16_33690 [Gammaproteobacteria bacterium]
MQAIRSGATPKIGDKFVVNGRTYGIHENGTLYPISGPGFHQLTRPQFKALGVYNKFGETARATQILDNMGLAQADRVAALNIWKLYGM